MHWMGWQKILVDKAKYVHGLQQMMGMIKLRPVMQGIEIGLGWGVSAQTFLETFPAAHLISVDSYRELEAIEKLRELYPDRFAYIHPDDELEVKPIKCQWLYIDAGHEYQDVVNDLLIYEPMLEVGGLLVFDDYDTDPNGKYHYPGVKLAVDEFMAKNRERFSDLIIPITESETGPICAVKLKG